MDKLLNPCLSLPSGKLGWWVIVRIKKINKFEGFRIMPCSSKHSLWAVILFTGETVETVPDFIFGGSKITADGDCSHEIKRCLLLGRKAMINLESILKSRDITLPTKVHLVKAMVFPVVIYGCESWTVKKAECQRIDAFELWCWRRLLRVPWTAGRPNQSILKEISLEYSLEGLNAEGETPILWPPDAKNWLIGEDPHVRKCLTGGFLRALSWVLCPSSSRTARCSQRLRSLCEAGLGLL